MIDEPVPPEVRLEIQAPPHADTRDSEAIWEGWAVSPPFRHAGDPQYRRVEAMRDAKRKAQQWVVDYLRREAPRALAGDPTAPPAAELIQTLTSEIKASFSGQEWAWRQNFLAMGLDRGRRKLRWQVRVPAAVVKLKLPGSPLNVTTFPELARFRALRDQFLTAITVGDAHDHAKNPSQGETSLTSNEPGTAFLSAVLFGGVASIKTLVGIAGALPGNVGVSTTLLWVDWRVDEDAAHPIWQRWIADPLTALLIAQCMSRPNPDRVPPASVGGKRVFVWKQISRTLDSLDLEGADRPTNLGMLLGWARTWYYRHVPAFLAAYASSQLASANLPAQAWARLVGIPAPNVVGPDADHELAPPRLSPLQGSADATMARLYTDLLALRQILRANIPDSGAGSSAKLPPSRQSRQFRTARAAVESYLGQPDLAPIVHQVGGWLKAELHVKGGCQPVRTLQAILRDLEAVDYELGSEILVGDAPGFDTEAFANLYARLLDRASSAVRRRTRTRVLIRFHEYLVREWGAPDDLESVFDRVDAGGGVNANLIVEDDFVSAWKALRRGTQGHDPEWVRTRRMALLLSYRCGLRRVEAQQLRLGDITGEHATELIVHPSRRKGLKSSNAQRRIPLHHLLSPTELAFLQDFCKDRRTDAARILAQPSESTSTLTVDDLPLFPFAADPFRPLPEAALFDPVVAVVREITQDPTLTQHHGRHGCVNHLTCQLMEAVLPGSALLVDPSWTRTRAETLRSKLIGGHGPNRQDLWIVSTLAGHASPEVTVGSYFHLCDWLLHCATRLLIPDLTPATVASIAALTVDEVNEFRQRLGDRVWFPLTLRTQATYGHLWPADSPGQASAPGGSTPIPPAPANPKASTAPAVQVAASTGDDTSPTAANILSLLAAMRRPNPDAERIARVYHVAGRVPTALLQAAAEIEAIIGSSRSARHARAAAPGALPTVQVDQLRLVRPLPPPQVPLTARERSDLETIYRSLQRMRGLDSDAVDRFLTTFHACRSTDRHEFRFGNIADATFVLQAILALRDEAERPLFALSDFRFVHQPLTRMTAVRADEQQEAWREALDLSHGTILRHDVEIRRARGAGDAGFLFMIPTSAGKQPPPTPPSQPQGKKPRTWSKGRGLALYAAAYVVTLLRISRTVPATPARNDQTLPLIPQSAPET